MSYLKFVCNSTGTDYKRLIDIDDIDSINSVKNRTVSMLMSASIVGVGVGFTLYSLIETSALIALISAIGVGILIFMLEKLIMRSAKNRAASLIRVGTMLLIESIVSVGIVMSIFGSEVKEEVTEAITREIDLWETKDTDYTPDIHALEIEIYTLDSSLNQLLIDAESEVAGRGKTGKIGQGITYKTMQVRIAKEGERIEALKANLTKKQKLEADLRSRKIYSLKNNPRENNISRKINAIDKVKDNEPNVMYVTVIIFLIIIFIEFTPILLKITEKETEYDKVSRYVRLEKAKNRKIASR